MRTNNLFSQITPKYLFNNYGKYKIKTIETRRFEINDYFKVLDSLIFKSEEIFQKELLCYTIKGKAINLIKFGQGKKKILMWSQMHGDESTASLALLDVINFLLQKDSLRNEISDKITLLIIPILNPDGASKFERRNSQEIDINRDALRFQTPEGKTLKLVYEKYKPDFAFNLHDQTSLNSVGKTGNPAAIALLAPPYNYNNDINETRLKAIKLCVEIYDAIKSNYGEIVARYDDEFEPRAFGDNFQKWSTSTILIESGGYFNDYEKQEIRKMNFIALITSIFSIANDRYILQDQNKYFLIPENEKRFFDLILQNCVVEKDSFRYIVDIGINSSEKFDSLRNRYVRIYEILDIGDLSVYYAYDTLDVKFMKVEFGKVYEKLITKYDSLERLDLRQLLKNGYTTIVYQGDFSKIKPNSLLDYFISTTQKPFREAKHFLGHSADLIIKDEKDKVRIALLNGNVVYIDEI